LPAWGGGYERLATHITVIVTSGDRGRNEQMVPHEHAPLTDRELNVLAELERELGDIPMPTHSSESASSWPLQLAGVIVVVVSTLLVAGLLGSGRSSSLIVLEAVVGIFGLVAGALIAIDPARRFIRRAPADGVRHWTRMRRHVAARRLRRRRLARRRPSYFRGT
jgi:hypothetical protein